MSKTIRSKWRIRWFVRIRVEREQSLARDSVRKKVGWIGIGIHFLCVQRENGEGSHHDGQQQRIPPLVVLLRQIQTSVCVYYTIEEFKAEK